MALFGVSVRYHVHIFRFLQTGVRKRSQECGVLCGQHYQKLWRSTRNLSNVTAGQIKLVEHYANVAVLHFLAQPYATVVVIAVINSGHIHLSSITDIYLCTTLVLTGLALHLI